MKKFKYGSLLLIFIAFIFLYIILKDNYINIINVFKNINYFYGLLALLLFCLYILFESYVLYIITKQYDNNYKFKNTLFLNIMTKFFNGITPFASGGQPLQVYELKKDGIKSSNGTLIVVEHFLMFQLSIVLLALVALILNFIFKVIHYSSLLFYLTIIGFVLNIGLLIMVFLICLNNNMCIKAGNFLLKLCYKLKIVKDYSKISLKWTNICSEYYNGFVELKKNIYNLLKIFICETLSLIFMLLVPYFIFISLNTYINIRSVFILSTYVFFVGSFFPVPGGSGGIEYAYIVFFSHFADQSIVNASLILWRFITYYLPVLIGGLLFSIKKFKTIKK